MLITVLIDIIIDYIDNDIYCKEILELKWDDDIISGLEVSYLSLIVKDFPDKIDKFKLSKNPKLTPDLIYLVSDCRQFRSNLMYPINKLITDERIEWENPNLLYEALVNKFIADNKRIKWESLGNNPSLSYNFIKRYRDKLGISVIFHPSAGDLLIDILNDNKSEHRHYVVGNPSFPFDKISDHKWELLLSNIEYVYELASNRNMPIEFISKYPKLRFFLYTICKYNQNIHRIIHLFPDIFYVSSQEGLMGNPAHYTFLVKNKVRDHLNNI